jgi:hypothetical protein
MRKLRRHFYRNYKQKKSTAKWFELF